jgi:hypothetical protein
VRLLAMHLFHFMQQKLSWLAGQADLDGDGEVTLEDSQIAYSRVAPVVRRHTAMTGGAIVGFVSSYSALR